MSAHLRNCPKHRKPLPCRHCAMIAKPLSVTAHAAPVVAESPKRGRPSQFGTAMTAAERKRRQREGPEREKLVQRIERRIKTSEHADVMAMREALLEFRQSLDSQSLDELREIAKTYRIHDRTGRLAAEGHTGGKNVERIDAAVQRDANGRKPRTGMTSQVFESVPFHELPKMSLRMRENVFTIWDCLTEVTESMFEGDEKELDAEYDPDETPEPTLRCRANGCGFRSATWFEARKHVEEMIKKGEVQAEFITRLEEIVEGGTAEYDGALAEARCVYRDKFWPHHAWARSFYQEFRDTA